MFPGTGWHDTFLGNAASSCQREAQTNAVVLEMPMVYDDLNELSLDTFLSHLDFRSNLKFHNFLKRAKQQISRALNCTSL
jgi:hypothetical protein